LSAVVVHEVRTVPGLADLIAKRQAAGLDWFDEVWGGVLHMSPSPHSDHQGLVADLVVALGFHAMDRDLGRFFVQLNVRTPGSGERDYRIPDLVFLTNEQLGTSIVDGWVEGPAALVVEVRSPREIPVQKLPFYARRGVGEVLVVDRDTRMPELFRRAGDGYAPVRADSDSYLAIDCLGVRIRRVMRGEKPGFELLDARTGERLPDVR